MPRSHAYPPEITTRSGPSADRPATADEDSKVRAFVLGRFEIVVCGRSIDRAAWRRTAAERLVKLLLVAPGHRVRREVASEALWPEHTPDGFANLRKAIHYARRALAPHESLVGDGRDVSLDGGQLELDLDRLSAALAALPTAESVAISSPAAGDAADVILEYGGLELLPDDPYEDWLDAPRQHLLAEWQRLALPAARWIHDMGRCEAAHALVDRLIERDPADEAAHRLAIELFLVDGRHEAAARQLARCTTTLRRDLGVAPSRDTLAAAAAAPGVLAGEALGREERPAGTGRAPTERWRNARRRS